MLIEFSVGNFRSFKAPVTFSMVAANITAQNKALNQDNLFQIKNLSLLKSAERLLASYGDSHSPARDNPSTSVHTLVMELQKYAL